MRYHYEFAWCEKSVSGPYITQVTVVIPFYSSWVSVIYVIVLDIVVSFVSPSSGSEEYKRKVWSFFRLLQKRFWQNPDVNRLKQSPHPYRLRRIHKPIQVTVLSSSLHPLKLSDFFCRIVRKHFHQYVCYLFSADNGTNISIIWQRQHRMGLFQR